MYNAGRAACSVPFWFGLWSGMVWFGLVWLDFRFGASLVLVPMLGPGAVCGSGGVAVAL